MIDYFITFVTSLDTKTFFIIGVATYLVRRYIHSVAQLRSNLDKINTRKEEFLRKKEQLRTFLTVDGKLLTEEKRQILSIPILDLVKKLQDGKLSPIQVLEAYQAKAILASDDTNCITDFLCKESRDRAIWLQENIEEKDRGPLYGIPISIKECFHVAGYDNTIGLVKYMNCPAKEDGAFVKTLKDLGANPFCLTNVPQTMLSFGSSNPIYGLTTNPHDKTRSPGGSSSGEAALLGYGGSILGLGTDRAGSVRIPAAFCGITSLKPTSGRIFEGGRRVGKAIGANSNAGFMAQTVDGVTLGMQSLLEHPEIMSALDHKVVPLPWKKELFETNRKLKIGWYNDDTFFPVVPGYKRALDEALKRLEAKGHETVPFSIPEIGKIVDQLFVHILADNGKSALEDWEGEILDKSIIVNRLTLKCPLLIRKLAFSIVKLFSPSTARGGLAACYPRCCVSTSAFWDSMSLREKRMAKFAEKMSSENVDVILCPGMAYPAPLAEYPPKLLPSLSYNGLYNVLDFPVGSVPVDNFTKQDEENMMHYPKTGDYLFKLIQKSCRNAAGMPLNVQVIGRPFQEELVLHAMKEVERISVYRPKLKQNS